MLQNLIVPLLLSFLTYYYLPAPETNLLVVFQSRDENLSRNMLEKIGKLKFGFKIIQNMDGHMEHVDVKSKQNYNYAVIAENSQETDLSQVKEALKKVPFIKESEVFLMKSNPMRVILLNLIIKVKGFFLSRDLSKESDQQLENIDSLCETEDKTPKVMINVIKQSENGKADIDAYTQKVIFELFPVIGSSVFYNAVALSDGWSQVALMQYANIESLCLMARSEEYMSVKHNKVAGLADTHTYLTQQIF